MACGVKFNVAGNLGLNYYFNYKTKSVIWDNKIIAAYVLTKLKGAISTKKDDRIEFTSLYGKKAFGYQFYFRFLNFKTQFDSGFDASTNTKISHFFFPAHLQVSP
jgi:hypothetical protein